MKTKKEIEILIQKFALNNCTEEEINELLSFFQDKNSVKDFPGVEELLPQLREASGMKQRTADRIFKHILYTKEKQHVKERKVSRVHWKSLAALLIIGLLINGFIDQNSQASGDTILTPRYEDITLQLNNGEIEVLEGKNKASVTDAKGNVIAVIKENKLIYTATAKKGTIPEYNTITVPYGKKFELILADGTQVHLNSGSSMKYPAIFTEGETRQVYLSGEAYFDVARDEERPFIVNVEELKVQVLGTSFNVAAYPEDMSTDVVLVEGSVGMFVEGALFSETENTALEPGKMGRYHRQRQLFSEKEVMTNIYTSWVHGELVFRNMPFENILKKLERNYNIEIINKRVELNQVSFNANFGDEPIEQILEYFSKIYRIHYTVKDNKVIIE